MALFPFEIVSEKDLSYLQQEIPKIIKSRFEGVEIPTEILDAPVDSSEESLRNAAIGNTCTHALWGKLVWEGDRFTLSASLMETAFIGPPREFTAAGESIENLLGAVQKLSDDIREALVPREFIADIQVEGNARIEDEAIKRIISTRPGDEYIPQILSRDLKSVYNMGYFDDIRIEAADSTEGKVITFHVKEKPTVKYIDFKGNDRIKTEKLVENVEIHPGAILNIFNIRKNIQRIELQYQEKNFHSAKVSYETKDLGNNQVSLIFVIDEGKKVCIKELKIVGNKAYSDRKLKKIMKTSEKGFFSWLTSSGDYKEEDMERDMAMLDAFYQNNGYMMVRIGDPEVETRDGWFYITIKIDEGLRYKVGNVDVAGDLILPKEELVKPFNLPKEKYFNRDVLREDILALTDLYSDHGYAFADVQPKVRQDAEDQRVNLTLEITKGEQVYFDRINISGNTKTRDKVIRRELKVKEQGLYSGVDLKKSVRNLERLDFFEEVKTNSYPGPGDNTMILNIDVTEKGTGHYEFGGGYSSVEHAFFTAGIGVDNFLGKGQSLSAQMQLGDTTQQFNVKFIEPWLFDIPLVSGITAYNWTADYDDYDYESMGGTISASYPFFKEDLRLFANYGYDVGKITWYSDDASADILDLTSSNVTSSLTLGASYDTRDKIINATRGQDHRFSVEYAGLGGDIGFTKLLGEMSWYIPISKWLVGFVHGEAGYIIEDKDKILPDYERFRLGGINSVRGFDYRELHLWDGEGAAVGGRQKIQLNLELQIPILKSQGLMGVLFFDTGQVFDEDANFLDKITHEDGSWEYAYAPAGFDLGRMRKTAGFGIRWRNRMMPIRIEYGIILDPRDTDSTSGQWEFTMDYGF